MNKVTAAQLAHWVGDAGEVLAALVALCSQLTAIFPNSHAVLAVAGVVFAAAKIASSVGVNVRLNGSTAAPLVSVDPRTPPVSPSPAPIQASPPRPAGRPAGSDASLYLPPVTKVGG